MRFSVVYKMKMKMKMFLLLYSVRINTKESPVKAVSNKLSVIYPFSHAISRTHIVQPASDWLNSHDVTGVTTHDRPRKQSIISDISI